MIDQLLANTELATVLGGVLASVLASAVSAVFPDKSSSIMKFINIVALNVGKAKNKPGDNV